MKRRQLEHPLAADELDAIARWYEAQQRGVGFALLDRVEETRKDLDQWPEASRRLDLRDQMVDIRSKQIPGFPLRIIYTVTDSAIIILAYAHSRRRPDYWRDRV